MENLKQKKKVSYDDILASLKMSVNNSGKLEIVRTDAEETKLKDQLVQKYSKPIKPNNNRQYPQQQQHQPNRSNAAKPQFNKPVTRVPIKPIPPSFIYTTAPPVAQLTSNLIKTKTNFLESYFSKSNESNNSSEEVKLKIVELDEPLEDQEYQKEQEHQQDELTEEQKEHQSEYREYIKQQQEYNKAIILHHINQHNERLRLKQTKSKKLLFATSNIRVSPSPINKLFGFK